MAITSTIVNDLSANTSTLTISQGTIIESIVYTYSTNSLLFSTQNSFTLSPTDYLTFAGLLDAYTAAILVLFNISTSIVDLSISQISNGNDGINQLTFLFQKANHALYNITATYPNGNIVFGNRNQTTTLTFQEFQYYHHVSRNFETAVNHYFKLGI